VCLVELKMKMIAVPGEVPVFGSEAIDLTLLTLAIPAMLAMFLGVRRDFAICGAILVGASAILIR
jgi:hypothetical protein